jgi:hypothetical protein
VVVDFGYNGRVQATKVTSMRVHMYIYDSEMNAPRPGVLERFEEVPDRWVEYEPF